MRTLPSIAVLLASGALAACATPAADLVRETLDERTGTTITHLPAPLALVAEQPRGPNADPFAFVGPFETNRMGARQMHLWFAVPVESGAHVELSLWSGTDLLARTRELFDPARMTLGAAPYRRSADWQREYGARLDAALLVRLTEAAALSIEVSHPDGRSERFTTQKPVAAALAEFRARVGL